MSEIEPSYEELVAQLNDLKSELVQYEGLASKKSKEYQVIPTFSVVIDNDGKLVDMNSTMLDALGYTIEDVIGEDYLTKFIPAPERDLLKEVFNELTSVSNSIISTNYILTKSGELLLVEWHGTSVFKSNNDGLFIIGIGVDVNEWKRCRERCEKLIIDIYGV